MLSSALKRLRQTRGLTQTEFAELLGASQADISRYELGQMYPTVSRLMSFCYILQVTPNQLLGVQDEV